MVPGIPCSALGCALVRAKCNSIGSAEETTFLQDGQIMKAQSGSCEGRYVEIATWIAVSS